MAKIIRWGILGAGNIAKKFAEGLTSAPDAKLVAVASRTQEKAESFGDTFHIPRRHGGYDALAADPEVDAVYVATPHPMHKSATILSLRGGKAVLCEKPFALNATEAREMIAEARSQKLFLMEAMWSRCFPAMAEIRKLLADGAIGEPRMLQADFGFRAGFDPKSRLFDPALGGGALLDVGVYTISFSSMVFGTPSQVAGLATIGKSGVDEQSAMTLLHPNGALSVLSCSVSCNTPHQARIWGTEGSIQIHSPFWVPKAFTLRRSGKPDSTHEFPSENNGYQFEAIEVGNCLRDGRLESDILPLDESVTVMETMDELRAQWGLRYPSENPGA